MSERVAWATEFHWKRWLRSPEGQRWLREWQTLPIHPGWLR